ncbi:MAG: cupin domain-containing protein [Rhizobiaceae bacterium]|nr:cupin domain-containing protein [Rhizobiaceae bacterium]
MKLFGTVAVALAALVLAGSAAAKDASGGEKVSQVFLEKIPNIPGKSVRAFVVDYAPGGASPSHRHDKSAFIFAYVLEGEIRSKVDDGQETVYKAGEHWSEVPGAHHLVSRNASKTKPAKLLAVFVLDSDATQPTTPDSH